MQIPKGGPWERDPSFDSGFENVEFDDSDRPHLVNDYSQQFPGLPVSPTMLEEASHSIKFSIPTLIAKIN